MDNIVRCPYEPNSFKIPDENFGQMLMDGIRNNQRTCLIDVSSGREITGISLAQQAQQIGSGLRSLGCGTGDAVGIFGPNSIEWVQAACAILYIDAIPAGINHLLKEDELTIHLESCCTKILFCDESLISVALAAVKQMTKHQVQIIVLGRYKNMLSLDDLLNKNTSLTTINASNTRLQCGKDPCVIMFSSGTTGIQKPVLLSQEGTILEYLIARHPKTLFVFDKTLLFAPLSHAAGLVILTAGLISGNTVYMLPKYDLELFIQTIAKYKMQDIFVVPPIATQLAKSSLVDQYKLELRSMCIGAAPLGREVELQLCKRFPGLHIRQLYGMTELSGVSTVVPAHIYKQSNDGSIGLPVFNTEMKVMDINSGEALGKNQPGEICVRSPLRMLKYINNDEATKTIIDAEGWLHTGDIGYYDEKSYFYITDRLKELIKYNAYQVAPAELESVLLSHPYVEDAAVVGIPHSSTGEVPMAVVVLKSIARATEQQIAEFVNSKVAAHKKLRGGVKFVSSIPKTGSGKILRREIKAQLFKNKL